MWIVRVALNRPYTFVVLALLILGIGPFTVARTPTDIFSSIDIPVIVALFQYGGLSAQEIADQAPVGTQPPFILQYNASSVPLIQLALSARGLSEQNLFDLGVNFLDTAASWMATL